MLEKFLRMSMLLDFYGALLTDRQRCCLRMHFLEDFSLTEIGDQLGVSRQAVYDIIHRSGQLLEEYEAKLGLAERHRARRQAAEILLQDVKAFAASQNLADCREVRQILDQIIHLAGREGEHDF